METPRLMRWHWLTWLVLLTEASFFGILHFACGLVALWLCVAFVGCTAFVTERWLRSWRAGCWFRWRAMLSIGAAAALLYTLLRGERIPGAEHADLREMLADPLVFCFTTMYLVSIACAIYTAIWLALWLIGASWRTVFWLVRRLETLEPTTRKHLIRTGLSILGAGFLVSLIAAFLLGRGIAGPDSSAIVAHRIGLLIMMAGFCLLLTAYRRPRDSRGSDAAVVPMAGIVAEPEAATVSAEERAPVPSAPRRRRPRWLGPLLAALIVTTGLGWFAHRAWQVHRHRAAIATIQAAGGQSRGNRGLPYEAWPARFFGEEFFHRGFDVRLAYATDACLMQLRDLRPLSELSLRDDNRITDAGLEYIGRFQELEFLDLHGAPITDAGLLQLARLRSLNRLDLGQTRITGTGLAAFREARQLWGLSLDSTQLTDAGLSSIGQFPALARLSLRNVPISGAGLDQLQRLRTLSGLSLSGAQLTDAGLLNLGGLTSLAILELGGPQITDAGLAALRASPRLGIVRISCPGVTDAGLVHLCSVPYLEHLAFDGTPITDRGLVQLQQLRALRYLDLINTAVTDAGLAHLRTPSAPWNASADPSAADPPSEPGEPGSLGTPAGPEAEQSEAEADGSPKGYGFTVGGSPAGLIVLTLAGPAFTDAGLVNLQGLTSLRQLHLSCPNITDAGVERLEQALPNLRIERTVAPDQCR